MPEYKRLGKLTAIKMPMHRTVAIVLTSPSVVSFQSLVCSSAHSATWQNQLHQYCDKSRGFHREASLLQIAHLGTHNVSEHRLLLQEVRLLDEHMYPSQSRTKLKSMLRPPSGQTSMLSPLRLENFQRR